MAKTKKPAYALETYVTAGEWRFRFVHRNGKIVLASTEGYERKSTMLRSLNHAARAIIDHNYDNR